MQVNIPVKKLAQTTALMTCTVFALLLAKKWTGILVDEVWPYCFISTLYGLIMRDIWKQDS